MADYVTRHNTNMIELTQVQMNVPYNNMLHVLPSTYTYKYWNMSGCQQTLDGYLQTDCKKIDYIIRW